MPPLTKKKQTGPRISGRQNHMKKRVASLSLCPQCKTPKMPHRVCPNCGYYKGREVIAQEEPSIQG